jgi:PAS domain S-box-containing protein
MTFAIANMGDGSTEQALRAAVAASEADMVLVDDPSHADVLVCAVHEPAALTSASDAQRELPDTQIVLRAPDPEAERLRAQISFVPGLASAWIVAASASPRSLATVLHKAASASARRRQLHVLRREINQQLSHAPGIDEAEPEYQRQRQLERSERYLATLLAQAPQGFVAISPGGEVAAWNAAAERICGVPARSATGRHVRDVFPAATAATILDLVCLTLERNTASARELKLDFAPGTIWAQVNSAPVHENGEPLCVSITIRDISDRHRITSALRASEQRYRTLTETLPQLIWTARPDGYAHYYSPQWQAYTGVDPAAHMGSGWLDAVHPDDRERAATQWRGAVEQKHVYDVDYRLRRADGSYRWFKARGAPIRDEDGNITEWFGTTTDIDDMVRARETLQSNVVEFEAIVQKEIARRAAAEDALHRAQKMEAIGTLTGGIAHDFNNILQVIGGNLHLLAEQFGQEPSAERRIGNALEGVRQGSKLAAQLLACGRRLPLSPKVINIGRLVRDMGDMLRRALGEGIELETLVAGGLWNTLVDRSNIESALLNLAINARDAMGGEGRLTIEVGNAFLDQEYADGHPDVSAGQYVMLAVTDTGCGMAPELIEKIFEPFFTTKAERGTGLGLSMVYGFVKQSSGHIKVYSEVGHGTTFKLYLPRSNQSEDLPVSDEGRPVRGGTETVLVVEDDDAVRELAVATLADLGYAVLKARDAEAALTIVESGVPIDLLFTDVVMPGPLKSPELARKARDRLPNLAVLYTSGYTQNAIVHHGRLDEGVELLSKPYSREALARKLRHVLANRPQPDAGKLARDGRPPPRARSRTVLLCEDEDMVRDALGELLEANDYRTLLASNGSEALRLAARNGFDVLVADIGLADMSGIELARRVRESRPDCPVLFASGRRESLPAELADAVFILKPFGIEELCDAIASTLGPR